MAGEAARSSDVTGRGPAGPRVGVAYTGAGPGTRSGDDVRGTAVTDSPVGRCGDNVIQKQRKSRPPALTDRPGDGQCG